MQINDLRRIVARNLQRLCKQRDLSLTMLADRAVVNTSYLYRVVNMESSPTVDWLCKVAEVLQVEPYELLKNKKK